MKLWETRASLAILFFILALRRKIVKWEAEKVRGENWQKFAAADFLRLRTREIREMIPSAQAKTTEHLKRQGFQSFRKPKFLKTLKF